MGIETIPKKLDVGDYAFTHNYSAIVDKKQDVVELIANICSQDHDRFKRECVRAKQNKTQLIILTEELHDKNSLYNWVSPVRKYGAYAGKPYTRVKGSILYKSIMTITERYGARFYFCNKEDTAKTIIELLNKHIKQ